MYRSALLLLALLLADTLACTGTPPAPRPEAAPAADEGPLEAARPVPASAPVRREGTGLYALSARSLEGQELDLAAFQGEVTLVVNVASQCGYTPQYAGLERLQQDFGARGFHVLAFPSNDFGGQEPGSAQEIAALCRGEYGATFPVAQKVQVRVGPGQSPVYRWLGQRAGTLPTWNFCKYLVGRDGEVVRFFSSNVTPDSIELRSAIAQALNAP